MPDQTPREQLAEIIKRETGMSYTSKVAADRIVSAGWRPPARVITDPAAADLLPVGTVVVNDGGQVAQLYDGPGAWWQVLDNDPIDSSALIGTGWITVLHTPENGDTP